MKVAKRFRWEGAHRLPWHTGGCQNLHGHSYYMWVELQGSTDEKGMLIDFKDIKDIINPLVEAWDHAVMVSESDTELIKAVTLLKSKHFVLPFDSTSENICQFVVNYLTEKAIDHLLEYDIASISVKVQETETCFAELVSTIERPQSPKRKNSTTSVGLYS